VAPGKQGAGKNQRRGKSQCGISTGDALAVSTVAGSAEGRKRTSRVGLTGEPKRTKTSVKRKEKEIGARDTAAG
jgi:hypothetical protein